MRARTRIYGRMSATLPRGISLERSRASLNALLVVCHGWRTPPRAPVVLERSAPKGWTYPLLRWARPMWMAAA